jgi:glycosyltransferase involved in cell wall biosynthesis
VPDPPRILVFRKRLLAWSETFIADQGRHLPGYDATFVGFRWDDSGRHLLADHDTCVQGDHARIAGLARTRLRLGLGVNRRWRRALARRRPALLHAHFGPDALAAIPIARELGVPLVATFHGFDITKAADRSPFGRRRGEVFAAADRIIAVSDFIARRLVQAGCPPEKIQRHYIGIDVARYDGERAEAVEPTVLFIGRLVPKKGCVHLLNAMRRVQERRPEAHLLIAGDGPLRPELEARVTELGLAHVHFLGVCPPREIRDHLRRAWVMCTPSVVASSGDAEGLGMVFLEAQAMGTPPVSFDTGGVVEAIADGETGRTVAEGDEAALSRALLRLLDDDELRRRWGRAGRERVCRRFDVRRQCDELESIYRSVVEA